MSPGASSARLWPVLLSIVATCLLLLHSAQSFSQGSGLASIRPLSTSLFPRLGSFTYREKEPRVWALAFLPQAILSKLKMIRVRRKVHGRGHGSTRRYSYARPVGAGVATTPRKAVSSPVAPTIVNMPTRVDSYTADASSEDDEVLITIRYTGGVGYKPLYTGVSKVIRENYPSVHIRKVIMAPTSASNKKQGLFEIAIDDHVFYSKQRDSPGVYLSMKDLETALENRRSLPMDCGTFVLPLMMGQEDNDS